MAPKPTPNTDVSRRVMLRVGVLRRARGWTYEEFAAQLRGSGLDVNRLPARNLEVGRRKVVTVDEALALIKVFSVTFEDLIEWNCSTCNNEPPAGFRCQACGAEARATPDALEGGR